MSKSPPRLTRDSEGFVRVDGVLIGRCTKGPDGPCLEFFDKDKRRAAQRGSNKIEVKLDDLTKIIKGGAEEGGL